MVTTESERKPTVFCIIQVDRLNGQTSRESAQTKLNHRTAVCAGALGKDGHLIVFGPELDLPDSLLSGGRTVSFN